MYLTCQQHSHLIPPAMKLTQVLPLLYGATVVVYSIAFSPLATMIPWSDKTKAKNDELKRVAKFLVDLTQQERINTKELKVLIRKV